MVFLSNYESSSFLCFSSIQWFNHWLYLDRKEKLVVHAIKIVKQSYLQWVFIHLQFFFDWEQPALELFLKLIMNTDICKLLYPSRIYCFSERQLYTQENYFLLSGCRGHVVLGTKKKIRYKVLH